MVSIVYAAQILYKLLKMNLSLKCTKSRLPTHSRIILEQ